jgi:hypothetical protein
VASQAGAWLAANTPRTFFRKTFAPSEMADMPTQREMTSKAFDKIAEGLNEALAIARGTAAPARLHVPAEMDVRAIRAKRIERTSRRS